MIKHLSSVIFVSIFFISCSHSTQQGKEDEQKLIINTESKLEKSDTTQTTFSIAGAKKSVVENGEEVEYYKSGVIKIRGVMKDGHREGVWKSWYEDGTPWSETTFKEGKKNGKTSTWYENGKKRYEGYYTNDVESGKWMVWDEKGKLTDTKHYD